MKSSTENQNNAGFTENPNSEIPDSISNDVNHMFEAFSSHEEDPRRGKKRAFHFTDENERGENFVKACHTSLRRIHINRN